MRRGIEKVPLLMFSCCHAQFHMRTVDWPFSHTY
jgi:hypothetical protein